MKATKTQQYKLMAAAINSAEKREIRIDLHDIRSVAAAIAHAVTTLDLIANMLDRAEWDETGSLLVPLPRQWHVSDGHETMVVIAENAEDAARIIRGDTTTERKYTAWKEGINADGEVDHADEESFSFASEGEKE